MAIYNTSYMDNATNIVDLFIGTGAAINNEFLIGNLILLTFSLVFFLFLYKNSDDYLANIMITMFVSMILAILLAWVQMIHVTTILFPFVLFIIALIFFLLS